MSDSDKEEENQENIIPKFHDLNLPPPTSFSLLSIHNNPSKSPIIFPPNNHENLHISTFRPHPHSVSDTSSTTSSSSFCPWEDSSSPNSPIKNLKNTGGIVKNCGWWDFGLELLTGKVNGSLRFLRDFWFVRGVLSFFRCPVVPVLVLVLVYFMWRRRRRIVAVDSRDGSNQNLLRVIREKNERINELLDQIARMNEVLLSMHKVSPSKAG